MRRSGRSEGSVNDDWIERGHWRGWGAPAAAVRHDPGAGRTLRAVAGRPREGGFRVPVQVGLIRDEDGEAVGVEVAGYRIGRLEPVAGAPDAGGAPRAICGLVVADGEGAEPELRLWLDRRLSPGHTVAVAHQREAIT
jgi:hypothetical protein